METTTLSKSSVLVTAALSLLFAFPLMASAQSNSDTDIPRVRVTAQACNNVISSGAYSMRLLADHREWRRENTPRDMGLEAWVSAHNAFLASQKEARILHMQTVIACNKYRGQLDVVAPQRTRVVLFNPSPWYLPANLARTGNGADASPDDTRVPQWLGISRISMRNSISFYGVTDRPTKRSIQLEANEAEVNRRFLR